MEETYFLGANSRAGFASLYRDFAAAPGDLLHVVKGGPGTGKSGFMRRIAEAAKERGLDAELVLCSGDPASLDGVYVPALRQGWMDGTAPHTRDPAHFGADGDYVDLGRFCRLPLCGDDRERVLALNAAYRSRYADAYRWLAAAGALEDAAAPPPLPAAAREKLRRRFRSILRRSAPCGEGGGGESRRFLSALSGGGRLRLPLPARYRTVCRIDSPRGLAPALLGIAAEEAAARGLTRILCLSPLEPARTEALLLPEAGLAFLGGRAGEGERGMHPDALLPPEDGAARSARRRAVRLRDEALASAEAALRQAKALHDELEAVYRPYMDFPALTSFTEETLARIFR